MRGLKQLRCTRVTTAGHAFIQNIHRGHYELGAEETVNLRILAAFDEVALVIGPTRINDRGCSNSAQCNSPRSGSVDVSSRGRRHGTPRWSRLYDSRSFE